MLLISMHTMEYDICTQNMYISHLEPINITACMMGESLE